MNNRQEVLEAPAMSCAFDEHSGAVGDEQESIGMMDFPSLALEGCPAIAFSFWVPPTLRGLARKTLRGVFLCGTELYVGGFAAFDVRVNVFDEGDYAATSSPSTTTVDVYFPLGEDQIGVFDLDITGKLAAAVTMVAPIVEITISRILSRYPQDETEPCTISCMHVRTLTLVEETVAVAAGTIQPWI